jgi:hypothetical protein
MDRNDNVTVATVANPFQPFSSRELKTVAVTEGMTIMDCAKTVGLAALAKDGLELRAGLNGAPVAPDQFDTVCPKPGDSLVLALAVHGGGGGGDDGKSWTQIILMVALVVVAIAAPYMLGGIFTTIGAGGATVLTGWGMGLTAGIMMGGSLLMNALMPAPKADTSGLGGTNWDASPTYGWDLMNNAVREGMVIPVIYGTMLVCPNVINSYVNVDANGYQFLNILYGVGEGPLTLAMVEDTDGIFRPAVYLNGDLASPQRTSGGRILQAELNDCLTPSGASADSVFPASHDKYTSWDYSAGAACNDCIGFLDKVYVAGGKWNPNGWVAWPFGLATNWWRYDFGTAGKRIVKYVFYAVEGSTCYKSSNSFKNYTYTVSTAWEFQGSMDGTTWTTLDTVTGYVPGTYATRTFTNTTAYRYYRVYGQWAIEEIEMFGAAGDAATVAAYAMPAWRSGDNDQTIIEGFDKVWSANTGAFTATKLSGTYYTATTDGDAVTALSVILSFPGGLCFYNDSGEIKPNTVTVQIQYKTVGAGSWTSASVWTITAEQSGSIQRSFMITGLAPAQYQVQVKWAATPTSGTRYISAAYWSALQSAIDDDFTYPNTALLGLHVLATDSYSGQAPRVTALVTRPWVDVRTSASPETWENKDAGNPAWAAYDMLVSTRYGGGVDPDDVLLTDFTAWASFCDNMVTGTAWEASHAYSLGDKVIPLTKAEIGSVFSAGAATGHPATYAVDGNTATEWWSSQTGTSVSGTAGIGLDLFTATSIKRLYLKQVTAGASSAGITSVKVQACDDGNTWVDVGSALTLVADNTWQDFVLSGTPTAKRYWRLLANANPASGKSWAIASLEMYSSATSGNGLVYECTAAGTSAAIEPAWPMTIDGTVTDGGATWTARLNYLRVNVAFDTATSVANALQDLAITGRASIVKKGAKYGVIIDQATSPVQLFTMGNVVKDSLKIDYMNLADRANVAQVTFFDADNDYQRTTVDVRDTAFDSDDLAERSSPAITLHGCTSRAQAIAYGRHMLNQNKYMKKVISFEAGIDAIACQPGDVILFSHDVPQWGFGGRVVSYAAGGPTLVLDRTVTIAPATSYVVQVRNQTTDVIEERAVVTGASTTATLTLASAFDADPGVGAVYSFGTSTNVTKEYRVLTLSRAADLTRKVTAVEYSDLIYTNGVGTSLPVPEAVSALVGVYGLSAQEVDQAGQSVASLSWQGAALTWDVLAQTYDWQTGLWVPFQTITVSTPYASIPLEQGRQYRFTVAAGGDSEYVDLACLGDGGWRFSISCDRTYSDKNDYALPVNIGWQTGDAQVLGENKPAVVPATGIGEFFSMQWPWPAHRTDIAIDTPPTEISAWALHNVKADNSDDGVLYCSLINGGGSGGRDALYIYKDAARTELVGSCKWWYSAGGVYVAGLDAIGNGIIFPEGDSGLNGVVEGSGGSTAVDKSFTVTITHTYYENRSYSKGATTAYHLSLIPQKRLQEDYRNVGSYMPYYFCVKPGVNVDTCALTWDPNALPLGTPAMYIAETSPLGWQPIGTPLDMSATASIDVTVSASDNKWFKVWFDGSTTSSTLNMYDRAQDLGCGAGLNFFSVDVFPTDPRPEAILPVEIEGAYFNEYDNTVNGETVMPGSTFPPQHTKIAYTIDPQKAYRLYSYSYVDRTFTCVGTPLGTGSHLTFRGGGDRLFGVVETMPLPIDPAINGPIMEYGGSTSATPATELVPTRVYKLNALSRMSVYQKGPE